MFEQTKALCDRFLDMGIPGLDLIVYKDGKCVLRYMGGYADPEKKIPIQGKEKYHIYSCSKLFTCVAALQLWEQGKFRLEDKLSDYIPEFAEMTVKTEDGVRPAKNPIRIHNLFEMTSGLNYVLHSQEMEDFYKEDGYRCPTLKLVKRLAQRPLEFEPGTQWLYSLSHDVLAALVELWSGEKFESYVKKHIFDPLGMTHSDFLHPIEDWEGFARQFRYSEATNSYTPEWKNPYRPGCEYASGGAGCVSTVEDYIKFLEALRIGDIILKKETIAMMSTNRLDEAQLATYTSVISGYGLGVRTPLRDPNHTEFGWGGAAGAFCCVDPANDLSIYYAQHVLTSPNRPLRAWLYDTVKADLQGETVQVPDVLLPCPPSMTY